MNINEVFNQNFKTFKQLNEKLKHNYNSYDIMVVLAEESINEEKDFDEVILEYKDYLRDIDSMVDAIYEVNKLKSKYSLQESITIASKNKNVSEKDLYTYFK